MLYKNNKKNESYYNQDLIKFNHNLLENVLCRKTGYDNCFIPKKITVIQMN